MCKTTLDEINHVDPEKIPKDIEREAHNFQRSKEKRKSNLILPQSRGKKNEERL